MNYDHKLYNLEKKYLGSVHKGYLATGKFVKEALHDLYDFYKRTGYEVRRVVGMREATKMFYKLVPEFPIAPTSYENEESIDWESYVETDIILVIGSFNSSRRVERRFWNKNIRCMILNLYDYFYFRGYELHTDFWNYCYYCGVLRHYYFKYGLCHKILNLFPVSDELAINAIWSRTFCVRKAYESKQGNRQMQAMYLRRFIYECVKGRDYLTAARYIEEYKRRGYEHADQYSRFLAEWEDILRKIKEKIRDRKQEDVVINWLDAISWSRVNDMPYVSRMAQEEISLKRAYTVTPWTSWCMKSIFSGNASIEGELYHYKKITGKKFELMREIKKQGFRFYYLGPRIFQKKVFLDRDCATTEMKEYEISFTFYYWKMLCLLAESRAPLFLIVHELHATHPPYFSPELNYYEEGNGEFAEDEQKRVSCCYTDEQVKWWDDFLNDRICRIYMGDHGDSRHRPNFDYLQKRTNVLFIVKNPKRMLEQTEKFFSLKNLDKLLKYILMWEDGVEDDFYSDAVCIEGFDRYEQGGVDELLTKKPEIYADYRNWMQFRALRAETDLLVRFANGEDWYFLLPDEETNHIEDEDCQKRIQELRNVLGAEFVDIWKEDFFINSRKLYLNLTEEKETVQ